MAAQSAAEGAAPARLGLFLFHRSRELTEAAVSAGLDGAIVDWEGRGKPERQAGWDTEIDPMGPEDVRAAAKGGFRSVVCRLNAFGPATIEELETALGEGATELLLPMVKRPAEVEALLEAVRGRAQVGILIETREALEHLATFSRLPIARIYAGLNDLAISRGTRSIFSALTDGSIGRMRAALTQPLGVAGATHPDKGAPIPCRLILAELARLGCQFTFLRRSFYRDTPPERFGETVRAIRDAFEALSLRTPGEIASDRSALEAKVAALENGARGTVDL
jgi:hypothetical protein